MNALMDYPVTAVASTEAEYALVGALMLDNSVIDRMGDKLKPEHFTVPGLGDIFAAAVSQIGKGHGCDVLTVYEAIPGSDLAYLQSIAQYVPSAANIRRYAEIIVERHKSRMLLSVSGELMGLAREHGRSIDDRVEHAQAQLAKLIDDAPRDEFVSAHAGMLEHTQVLDDRAEGKIIAWPTGLTDLDEYLEGGLRPGSLVIIGARPSMGKTALCMTMGLRMAETQAVAMLSMEMPHSDVRDRMTAILGNVSLSSVQRPNRGDGLAWGNVMAGVERAKSLRFFVSDQGGLNINQVRSKARNVKRLHGLQVLLVDYIGLMNGLDAKMARAYQLEEISRGLKALAKELDIAVVCLAQVNRKVEERADATPSLSDLRDSGAIEQDADIVMFVHRPIQAKQDLGGEWANYAKLSIAKNRQGRCGIVNLSYIGEQTRFSGWSGDAPSKSSYSSGRAGI